MKIISSKFELVLEFKFEFKFNFEREFLASGAPSDLAPNWNQAAKETEAEVGAQLRRTL